MSLQTYLAVDLGAGSGRVVAGLYDGKTLRIADVNRFANQGFPLPSGWHWNITQLFSDIKAGIGAAHKTYGNSIQSVAVDTWGVDYGLVDARGRLLGLPWMYRDGRTDGLIDWVTSKVSKADVYGSTGIQFLFFNTLYQLAAESRDYPEVTKQASRLLFVPDLLTYWLSGEQITERTIASTSQMLKAGTAEWDLDLAAAVGIPTHFLQNLTEPGTAVGFLRPDVMSETGCGKIRMVACGSHDTASAVAGVPSTVKEPLFLSSGTWSLVGRELAKPILSEDSFANGFSNEQGLAGTTRFLKNVAGMWLLQECKRSWDVHGLDVHYGHLVEQARDSRIESLLDPDAEVFQKPCDMPAVIAEYLTKTGQAVPSTPGQTARIILQSLALKYREVVTHLRRIMPDMPDTLHIVGGGSQNALLNQMTADATGLRVEAGPVEATAAGNVLAQLMAAGEISSLEEGRELLRASFEPTVFEPKNTADWTEKQERFAALSPA
jgi:rhamnulokinase